MVNGLRESPVGEELLFSFRSRADKDDEEQQSAFSGRVEQRWQCLRKKYWPRITYTDAVRYLQSAAVSAPVESPKPPVWGSGLQLEHEKFIAAEIGRGLPVFVTHYPCSIKPFYMLASKAGPAGEEGQATVANFDLLVPDMCEIVGGSRREHDLTRLKTAMQDRGLYDLGSDAGQASHRLEWYLDLRRYGSVPHGGFGLGLDRLIGYLAGVDNVKDVVAWPRYHGRCEG